MCRHTEVLETGERNTPGRRRVPVPTSSQQRVLTYSQKPCWGIKSSMRPQRHLVEWWNFVFYDLVRIIQEQLCIDKILGNKFK